MRRRTRRSSRCSSFWWWWCTAARFTWPGFGEAWLPPTPPAADRRGEEKLFTDTPPDGGAQEAARFARKSPDSCSKRGRAFGPLAAAGAQALPQVSEGHEEQHMSLVGYSGHAHFMFTIEGHMSILWRSEGHSKSIAVDDGDGRLRWQMGRTNHGPTRSNLQPESAT